MKKFAIFTFLLVMPLLVAGFAHAQSVSMADLTKQKAALVKKLTESRIQMLSNTIDQQNLPMMIEAISSGTGGEKSIDNLYTLLQAKYRAAGYAETAIPGRICQTLAAGGQSDPTCKTELETKGMIAPTTVDFDAIMVEVKQYYNGLESYQKTVYGTPLCEAGAANYPYCLEPFWKPAGQTLFTLTERCASGLWDQGVNDCRAVLVRKELCQQVDANKYCQ